MKVINVRDAMRLLRKAVKARGPETRSDCEYRNEQGEYCIAGWVMNYCGVDLTTADAEIHNNDTFGEDEVQDYLKEEGIRFTPAAITAISMAQAVQDGRFSSAVELGGDLESGFLTTWGHALATVERWRKDS